MEFSDNNQTLIQGDTSFPTPQVTRQYKIDDCIPCEQDFNIAILYYYLSIRYVSFYAKIQTYFYMYKNKQ